MQGILVFKSMAEANARGYQFFSKTEGGYLVRTLTRRGWALAVVRD